MPGQGNESKGWNVWFSVETLDVILGTKWIPQAISGLTLVHRARVSSS